MSLISELKRRNVFRVGIAYLVASWLLLQLAEVLTELLALPDWAGKLVVLLLVVGFIPALILAWAFELTPDGIKREKDVDRDQSITHLTGRKLDRTIIIVLFLAVAYFVYERASLEPRQPTAPATGEVAGDTARRERAEGTEPSIAVLPFVNLSNDPEQEFFSDGISEELLNLLVRVEGLKVASRTSSFTYKGANRNIPDIARELKVDHILEGSVRRAANRVRITAQLIDTDSDRHLWSDTFDRELTDIFTIQDEIANAIVAALRQELGTGLDAVTVEADTTNLDAYQLYLKARSLFVARKNLAESIRLFEQAIAMDLNFARAWEGLAAAHLVSASWLAGDGIDHNGLAFEAANRALEIDPGLSMPYAVRGMYVSERGPGFVAGMEDLDTATASDPKNATAWLWRGIMYKDLGYFAEAIADLERCLSIDPAYQNCRQHLAEALLFAGQEERAIALLEETLEHNFHSVTSSFLPHYLRSGQRVTALVLAAASVRAEYAPVRDWIDALEHPEQDHAARVARWQQWAAESNLGLCNFSEVALALRRYDCFSPLVDGRAGWQPMLREFRKTAHFKQAAAAHYLGFWRQHGFPPQCRPVGETDFACD